MWKRATASKGEKKEWREKKRDKSLSILDGKVMKQNKEGEWWELNNHFKAMEDKG